MRRLVLGILFVLGAACCCLAAPRQWTDSSGKFQIEATLVTVKDGKVYLEKSDSQVTPVDIDKLSSVDQDYLLSLPEYRAYFEKNPIAGKTAPPGKPKPAAVGTSDEKIGEVRRFTDLGVGLHALAFSPDGTRLAVGRSDGTLAVVDVRKGVRVGSVDQRDPLLGEVSCLAFTPDGKRLLSGRGRGRIQVWNIGPQGTLAEAGHFAGHSGAVHTITVGSDGRTVISGGDEKKLRCWELDSGREQFAIDSFKHPVKAFVDRAEPQAGPGHRRHDAGPHRRGAGQGIAGDATWPSPAQAVAISRDGSLVAAGGPSGIRVWDARTGRPHPVLQDREPQRMAEFLFNGRYLLSGATGKVNLWDLQAHRKIYEFDVGDGPTFIQTLASSADNRYFTALSLGGVAALQIFRLPAEVEK